MSSSFQIATYAAGVGALASLDELTPAVSPDPQFLFYTYAELVKLGDGTIRGVGPSATEWFFALLTTAQRNVLAAYCTAASAQVYIQTPDIDGTFIIYLATMSLPEEEPPIKGGLVKNYTIRFDFLEVQT
jgi:hypothetical protein